MGRLIDTSDLSKHIGLQKKRFGNLLEVPICNVFTDMIRDTPTAKAISKADYEARLKADMVAMLTEIQLEIADNVESIIGHYDASTPERKRPLCKSARNEGRTECIDVIQQKINALKGE